MTRQELNLAIFEGRADRVLWQPVLETWISHHMERGTLPMRFQGMANLEIYDALGCSVRYEASTGILGYLVEGAERVEEQYPDHTIERVITPRGEVRTVYQDIWEDGRRVNHRIREFPVKTVTDLSVLTDFINRQRFCVRPEAYHRARERVGHRAEPTIRLSSSGFTDLIKIWSGLPGTYYLLHDHPAEVEAYLEACDRCDDRLIDEAVKLPCRIFSLADHATNEFTPPPILKKYLLPRWQRITDRLHSEGRFVHTHWDGNSRTILPFLRETGMDAVEALTPEPMGDITLEEIKHAVGDKMVVLDLLPAIDFLAYRPVGDLLECARRVIDMFAPRLVLGISDEISQIGEIDRVQAVTELLADCCGLAD